MDWIAPCVRFEHPDPLCAQPMKGMMLNLNFCFGKASSNQGNHSHLAKKNTGACFQIIKHCLPSSLVSFAFVYRLFRRREKTSNPFTRCS